MKYCISCHISSNKQKQPFIDGLCAYCYCPDPTMQQEPVKIIVEEPKPTANRKEYFREYDKNKRKLK